MIATLAVENYRSLRRLIVPLAGLTVVTGANGTGKSSLYRALRLLADAARNGAVAALAREGGLPSTLWAGPETTGRAVREGIHPMQGVVRARSVSLRLGFGGDDFSYAIDFGLPSVDSRQSAFALDPAIKRESIWHGPLARRSGLALAETVAGSARDAVDSWLEKICRCLEAHDEGIARLGGAEWSGVEPLGSPPCEGAQAPGCTPCEWSATSSPPGQRVDATRARSASSSASEATAHWVAPRGRTPWGSDHGVRSGQLAERAGHRRLVLVTHRIAPNPADAWPAVPAPCWP